MKPYLAATLPRWNLLGPCWNPAGISDLCWKSAGMLLDVAGALLEPRWNGLPEPGETWNLGGAFVGTSLEPCWNLAGTWSNLAGTWLGLEPLWLEHLFGNRCMCGLDIVFLFPKSV